MDVTASSLGLHASEFGDDSATDEAVAMPHGLPVSSATRI